MTELEKMQAITLKGKGKTYRKEAPATSYAVYR